MQDSIAEQAAEESFQFFLLPVDYGLGKRLRRKLRRSFISDFLKKFLKGYF